MGDRIKPESVIGMGQNMQEASDNQPKHYLTCVNIFSMVNH